MLDLADTIAAIATVRAGGVRGIVRISGPSTVPIVSSLVRCDEEWKRRQARPPSVIATNLFAGPAMREVPCEIYLWPQTRSYTRQPAAELHTVGSLPVLDAVLAALCTAGARLARPGEFTMRAFLAGRLDLTQAEAVLGVIEAATQNELDVALLQLAGGLAGPLRSLREQLLNLLAHLEAGLDFVEDDIEFISAEDLEKQLQAIAEAVGNLSDQVRTRGDATSEPRVVLRGLPNVGKSSLFNALLGAERSIVSEVAATTRDYVSSRVELAGHAVQLVDTAGVEDTTAAMTVTSAAQQMTVNQSQQAALELFCLDATRPLHDWERRELAQHPAPHRVLVLTKCDAGEAVHGFDLAVRTSSRTAAGLDDLRRAIAETLNRAMNAESVVVSSTAVRCADSLRKAAESLRNARELVHHRFGEELVAAELRVTLDELGTVVGAVYTDDILDRVFSRFCIGK